MVRNRHVTNGQLDILLADKLPKHESQIGTELRIEPLGELKPVEDATAKFLLRSVEGKPEAVVVCASQTWPDLVLRGTEKADQIRNMVGPKLGKAIIRPIDRGYVEGRSYVVLPWYREFSLQKVVRAVQRRAITLPLLKWLRGATAAAAKSHARASGDARPAFASALDHLLQRDFVQGDVRDSIKRSMRRLDSERWKPCHAFDHNDLWMGNVMLKPKGRVASYPYVLIDWGGANERGYGIYDLMRLALDLNLPGIALRRELLAHSKLLHCAPEDTKGHLLAAFGRLHQHLEHFPEEMFIRTLNSCWARMTTAMPA